MPKIIANAEQNILREARRQIREQGYSAVTMKSVAAACGLAVGTLYNYFPSKELLVARFMLEDWQQCLSAMALEAEAAESPRELLLALYEGLTVFGREHSFLFKDPGAGAKSQEGFPARHLMLRSQLAALLQEPVRRMSRQDTDFLPDFLAENLLIWTGAETDFETVCRVLTRLF